MAKRKRKPMSAAQLGELLDPNTEGLPDGYIWDSPKLYVQVRGDSRSWTVKWTQKDGRVASMGLGSCYRVGQREARRLTAKYIAMLQEGRDPRVERDAERVAAGEKPLRNTSPAVRTFRDAARAYLAEFETQWKSENHALQWAQTLRDYVYPVIGDVPLGSISVDHIVEVMQPIWRTKHVTAKKVRTRIRLILDWAEAMEWHSGDNPTRSKAVDIRLGNGVPSVKHFEAIPYKQMPGFWSLLAEDDTVKGDVTRFMILTAVRANEALGATWDEIDLEQRVWTIPEERMKMERGHRVPLSDQAIAVLEKRRALAGDDLSGLIFPSPNGKPLHRSVPNVNIKRLRGTAETAHGCRSTFVEWCDEEAHVEETVREKCLAHKVRDAVVAAYARSDMMGRREPVMQAWADYVTGRS